MGETTEYVKDLENKKSTPVLTGKYISPIEATLPITTDSTAYFYKNVSNQWVVPNNNVEFERITTSNSQEKIKKYYVSNNIFKEFIRTIIFCVMSLVIYRDMCDF